MKNLYFLRLFFVVALLLAPFSAAAFAQTATAKTAGTLPDNTQSGELNSKFMARKMPYRVVLPVAYEQDKTARFPVLYLLHGLSGNHTNWTTKTSVSEFAKAYRMIVVTPEGAAGWYTDSATVPNDKYESYIADELIAEIDRKFRTVAERRGRAVAGLSMGGFGALKFGVKHPEKFVFAASLSGAVSIASWQKVEQVPAIIRPSLLAIFGDADSQTKKSNDLFQILGGMPAEKVKNLPFIYLDCGTEDELNLLEYNQQMAAILVKNKVPHEFRQLPGRHSWTLWNQQIEDILRISNKFFNVPLK